MCVLLDSSSARICIYQKRGFVKTIEIVAGFLKFDLKCAAVKKKNPEQYRQMKEQAYRMTNNRNSGYHSLVLKARKIKEREELRS